MLRIVPGGHAYTAALTGGEDASDIVRPQSTACPLVDPTFVVRSGVIDALATPGVRVVVVTAPGGYGKTSHVASWPRATPGHSRG